MLRSQFGLKFFSRMSILKEAGPSGHRLRFAHLEMDFFLNKSANAATLS
jgi:hypothetical protein